MTGAGAAEGPPAGAWGAPALVALALVLLLPGFFALPPFDRDEARFAQASRQMVESGDLVDIRFQDEPRHKKPIGIYWLQAAAVTTVAAVAPGEARQVWPYRLPSVIGALIAVLATAALAARLFGPGAALPAGLMLAGCVLLGVEARMAKTDAALLAAIVLAQACLARAWLAAQLPTRHALPGWATAAGFWTALGVGCLIKGPIILLVTGTTAAVLALGARRAGWLAALKPLVGLVWLVLLVAPWLVAIHLATDGAFFAEAVGHDLMAKVASGQESHGQPPGFYLATVWITLAPFAALVPVAAPWVWRNRRTPAVALCLAWIVPSWILFELVPTKLLHYVLPTFPAIALLTAAALSDPAAARPPRWLVGLGLALGGIGFAALVGAVGFGPVLVAAPLSPWALGTGAVALIGFAVAGVALWRGDGRRALLVLAAAVLPVYWATYQVALPAVDALWVPRGAAAALAAHRADRAVPCPDRTVAVAGFGEPSMVFLLGTGTRIVSGAEAAAHMIAQPAAGPAGCAVAFVEEREMPGFRDRLDAAGADAPALAEVTRITGFNYSKGRPVVLTLFAPAPAAAPRDRVTP